MTILTQQSERLQLEKADLEHQLSMMEKKFNRVREKCSHLEREGNTLKRYNSKLVFNSFVSDLTEVPKNGTKSQSKVKEMIRGLSASSQRGAMYDISGVKPEPHSKDPRDVLSENKSPVNNENSITEFNQIEVSNQLINKYEKSFSNFE